MLHVPRLRHEHRLLVVHGHRDDSTRAALQGGPRRLVRHARTGATPARAPARIPGVSVEAIHLGPDESGPLSPVRSATAVAGKGLEGDRYFFAHGARPGQALTLVEAEEVERAGLEPGATRRQVTTRGVRLNDLVGKRFRVGEVECLGVELCEPCSHLESMTRPGLITDLVHRAGLNADVLTGGTITVGDEVAEL